PFTSILYTLSLHDALPIYPALGFYNGELRFWLGWAEEVSGDHSAAQQTWRQARTELEPFLQQQPDNYNLIGDLALTNMFLGNKEDRKSTRLNSSHVSISYA